MSDKAAMVFVVFLAGASLVSAGADEGSGANAGRTFAIIVTGISKEPQYSLSRDSAAAMLRAFLTGAAKVDAENLKVLLGCSQMTRIVLVKNFSWRECVSCFGIAHHGRRKFEA